MSNSLGTVICAICIAALEYSNMSSMVSIPLVLLLGFLIGRLATRKLAL